MDLVIPDVMNDVFLPKEDTLKIWCRYLYGSVSGRAGIKKGGTWRTLRVPDGTLGGQGHP